MMGFCIVIGYFYYGISFVLPEELCVFYGFVTDVWFSLVTLVTHVASYSFYGISLLLTLT